MSVDIYHKAEALPDFWDTIADTPFLEKKHLQILEQANPCNQKYHMTGSSIFVTYRLKLDLFTYNKARLKIPCLILGVPLSVSCPGHNRSLNNEIMNYLDTLPGSKLILNTWTDKTFHGFTKGRTLSTAVLTNKWHNFNQYLDALRSPYRYRIRKAARHCRNFQIIQIRPKDFTRQLYDLYLNVYRNSAFKLEKLSPAFFKTFPAVIFQFNLNEKPVGFVQLYQAEHTLYFMFGGMDYKYVKKNDLYLNMLIEIIRYGINNGFHTIELGQTAEDIKHKLGAVPKEKMMLYSHSNKIINCIAGVLSPILVYRKKNQTFRVFKKT